MSNDNRLQDNYTPANKYIAGGFLKVEKVLDDGTIKEVFDEKNLVLNIASDILRDLMFGDNERVEKIQFGDMNLSANDDTRNVAAPTLSDTSLINNLFEKNLDKTKSTYGGYPAIEYSCTLEKTEFNGSGEQLITEFALVTGAGRLFTRKTRAAIYKDSETKLKFTWWLVFN